MTARRVALLIHLSLWCVNFSFADSLSELSATIQADFPEVQSISVEELDTLRKGPHRPMLLDVREEKEFAVSHLAGAVRAEDDAVAQLRRLGFRAERPIVVYCSVGYRSAKLASTLQKAGFTNVRNLKGSLFAWANAGRPLVNAGGPVDGVHPYNPSWGRFLDKSKWRWSP